MAMAGAGLSAKGCEAGRRRGLDDRMSALAITESAALPRVLSAHAHALQLIILHRFLPSICQEISPRPSMSRMPSDSRALYA